MSVTVSSSVEGNGIVEASSSPWVTTLAVCTFDLDVGNVVESTCPTGRLTKDEELCIAYHAFPDSMSSRLGDTVFTFRIRGSRRAGEIALPLVRSGYVSSESGNASASSNEEDSIQDSGDDDPDDWVDAAQEVPASSLDDLPEATVITPPSSPSSSSSSSTSSDSPTPPRNPDLIVKMCEPTRTSPEIVLTTTTTPTSLASAEPSSPIPRQPTSTGVPVRSLSPTGCASFRSIPHHIRKSITSTDIVPNSNNPNPNPAHLMRSSSMSSMRDLAAELSFQPPPASPPAPGMLCSTTHYITDVHLASSDEEGTARPSGRRSPNFPPPPPRLSSRTPSPTPPSNMPEPPSPVQLSQSHQPDADAGQNPMPPKIVVGECTPPSSPGKLVKNAIGRTQSFHMSPPATASNNNSNGAQPLTRSLSEALITTLSATNSYFYGYVFFRQRPDPTISRGYFQKSVVIITRQPFATFFHRCISIIGERFFAEGSGALEEAFKDMAAWPQFSPGESLVLKLLGMPLNIRVPTEADFTRDTFTASATGVDASTSPTVIGGISPTSGTQSNTPSSNTSRVPGLTPLLGSCSKIALPFKNLTLRMRTKSGINFAPQTALVCERPGLFQDINLYSSLGAVVSSLTLLWELVLTGESILVLSPTPAQCSAAVLCLTSLITPLSYACDFRPYFTIHDSDFKMFTQSKRHNRCTPRVILGCTNPFFIKALQHWPTVVSIGKPAQPNSGMAKQMAPSQGQGQGAVQDAPCKPKSTSHGFAHKVLHSHKRKHVNRMTLMTDYREKVWTDLKPVLSMDDNLLRQLVHDADNNDAAAVVNDDLLRRFCLELTTSFLAAFDSYFEYKRIPPSTWPFVDLPQLPPFVADDFLKRMSSPQGPVPPSGNRSNWVQVYRRFIQSPNFGIWFESRRKKARLDQCAHQQDAIRQLDMDSVAKGLREVQLMDCFIKINTFAAREQVTWEDSTLTAVWKHLGVLLDRMALDVRHAMHAKIQLNKR
mmetsp:Transcript_42889/g.69569  ORF Transcript_42889/g.69569 Transcript_42889/m.69569 type:complete len:994 (+) Transcript_42889:126-3107(+)